MIIEIILALALPPIIYFVIEYIEHVSKIRKYPKGPFPLPVIGNLHLLSSKPYEDLIKLAAIYGDMFSLSFGMKRTVILNTIEIAKEALVHKSEQFAGRPSDVYTTKLLSRGHQMPSLADYGPYWKAMRKLFHSALKHYGESLQNVQHLMTTESEELHDALRRYDEKDVDPENDIGNAILNVVCQVSFGHRYERDSKEFKDILLWQKLVFAGLGASDAVAFLPWLKIFPLQGITSLKKGMALRDPILRRKVQEHKRDFDPENIKDFTDALIQKSTEQKFLEKAGIRAISDSNLEMIVNDLFVGGTETLLTTIRWFLVHMLHWPEFQDKIYEEITNKIGFDRYPQFSDRQNLHFLHACINEELRLSSITPLGIPRKATENTNLNGISIPKGAQVIINFWNIHMNEKHWDKPKQFNPYRFLDEDEVFIEPGRLKSFVPFSAGIRGCPGEAFAKLEMFMMISRMFRDFRVELPKGEPLPSLEGELGITLSPKPFNIVFKPRNNNKATTVNDTDKNGLITFQ